jgi:hypothetical protein
MAQLVALVTCRHKVLLMCQLITQPIIQLIALRRNHHRFHLQYRRSNHMLLPQLVPVDSQSRIQHRNLLSSRSLILRLSQHGNQVVVPLINQPNNLQPNPALSQQHNHPVNLLDSQLAGQPLNPPVSLQKFQLVNLHRNLQLNQQNSQFPNHHTNHHLNPLPSLLLSQHLFLRIFHLIGQLNFQPTRLPLNRVASHHLSLLVCLRLSLQDNHQYFPVVVPQGNHPVHRVRSQRPIQRTFRQIFLRSIQRLDPPHNQRRHQPRDHRDNQLVFRQLNHLPVPLDSHLLFHLIFLQSRRQSTQLVFLLLNQVPIRRLSLL